MSDQTTSAMAGAFAGIGVPLVRELDRNDRRSRNARDTADEALSAANEALARLDGMGAGDIERIGADRVADLMGGVALPATSAVVVPATFPTPPTPPSRPVFDEGVAGSFLAYPGSTNEYNKEGKMVDPTSPFSGQNYATGVALSSVEVRSALMGLMRQAGSNPSAEHVKAIYRFFQGITRALTGNAQSQDEITAAIARVLSEQPPIYRKIAQFFSASGVVISGAATETVVFSLGVPANSLINLGDALHVNIDGYQVSINAADTTTLRIRQGSVGGPVLVQMPAIALSAGDGITGRLIATLVAAGQIRTAGPFGRNSDVFTGIGAFDPTVDQSLVLTVQHSTNNAANQTRFDAASLFLAR